MSRKYPGNTGGDGHRLRRTPDDITRPRTGSDRCILLQFSLRDRIWRRMLPAARLADDHEVIALMIIRDGDILTATENGFGKRTALSDFRLQGRGGKGVIAIKTSDRNGRMVGAIQVGDDDEAMLISTSGTLVRTPVTDISVQSRNTQGVRLIRLAEGDRLVGLDRIVQLQDEEE